MWKSNSSLADAHRLPSAAVVAGKSTITVPVAEAERVG
jgi:hypothetical protein